MKKLIAVSNHSPENWSYEQSKGWDEIVYIPFPNVDASLDVESVSDMAEEVMGEINSNIVCYKEDVFVCIQGESTLCDMVKIGLINKTIPMAIPTTERVVKETVMLDGSTRKTSEFRFIRWRLYTMYVNDGNRAYVSYIDRSIV